MAFNLSKTAIIVGALICGSVGALLVSSIDSNITEVTSKSAGMSCSVNEVYDSSADKCVAAGRTNETSESKETGLSAESVHARISSAVNLLIPNLKLKPEDISYIEQADLYAFVLEGKVFYSTQQVKAFISGDVLDLSLLKAKPERSNVTLEISKNFKGGAPEYVSTSSVAVDAESSSERSQALPGNEIKSVEQRISGAVNKLIPNLNLQPHDVSYIDSVDLYAFMLAGKMFYTTENVKSLISGDVLDLELLRTNPERSNLTTELMRIYSGGVSEEKNANVEYNISKLDRTKTINIGPDSAVRKFAVMFDISCPKSRDLYPKLIELAKADKNVQFNLMLISRSDSPSVERKSKDIFCASNNQRALDFYMKTSILDQSLEQVQGCSYNPDYPSILMGDQFSGTTPVFYSTKNNVLVGNKDINKIRSYIAE